MLPLYWVLTLEEEEICQEKYLGIIEQEWSGTKANRLSLMKDEFIMAEWENTINHLMLCLQTFH